MEDEIFCFAPETVMACIAETVVDATLGAVPAFEGVRTEDLRPL